MRGQTEEGSPIARELVKAPVEPFSEEESGRPCKKEPSAEPFCDRQDRVEVRAFRLRYADDAATREERSMASRKQADAVLSEVGSRAGAEVVTDRAKYASHRVER